MAAVTEEQTYELARRLAEIEATVSTTSNVIGFVGLCVIVIFVLLFLMSLFTSDGGL